MEGRDVEILKKLAVELLCRQPATFADIINGEIPGAERPSDLHP